MKTFSKSKKRFTGFMHIAVAVFVIVTLLGTNYGLEVPHAHALIPVEEVGAALPAHEGNWWTDIVTTVEQTINTVSAKVMEYKAFSLDRVAWNIAKLALAQIQKETVNWINSGFKTCTSQVGTTTPSCTSSPMFVQDLGGFLQDNADKLAGEFIYGSELKALCSPFYLNIKIALSIKTSKRSPVQCTLSKVVGNVENFLGGNFAAGGLPGWFEMTVNPNNNFFGASASAESALFGKLATKEKIDLNKLLYGKGFLGKEECPAGSRENTNPGVGYDPKFGECITSNGAQVDKKTVTPGDTISNSLNKALGLGEDKLVQADQFNEVISALFQQLAVQVLTGARGLLGTSDATGGKPSYLDQINDPRYDTTPGQNTIETHFIDTAITDESAFRALYADIVGKADALFARITQLEALNGTETAEGKWECGSFEGIRAQTTAIRDPALVIQTKSDKNLAVLNDLNTSWKTTRQNAQYSTASAEENIRISETFLDLQSSGVIHRASEIPAEKRKTDPIVAELAALAGQAETICRLVPKSSNTNNNTETN